MIVERLAESAWNQWPSVRGIGAQLVHREDVPLQIQDEDGIDDAIEDGAIARFTVAQGRLGGADLGGARLGLPYQLSAEFAAALLVGSRFPLAWLEDGAVLHTDRGAIVVGSRVRHLPPGDHYRPRNSRDCTSHKAPRRISRKSG